jgi:hypothetical protein
MRVLTGKLDIERRIWRAVSRACVVKAAYERIGMLEHIHVGGYDTDGRIRGADGL